jgi:hypothetical protein
MELSKLEICKGVAEIEGHKLTVEGVGSITGSWFKVDEDILHGASTTRGEYNPLTDDALCFRLMLKYKVLQELTGDKTYRAVICNWGKGSEYYRGTGTTLNMAICLAIIEAHKVIL